MSAKRRKGGMNTVACRKCAKQTTNPWGHCKNCPSLEEAAYLLYVQEKEKQDAFIWKLQEEDVDVVKLLKFTREDESWLKDELGLTKGKRQDLIEWIETWKGISLH